MAASTARHTRAHHAFHPCLWSEKRSFQEKGEGLESVPARLFRRTGKSVSVSKPTSDTETETKPEFPFPHVSPNNFGSSAASSLTEIATCSPVPASDPSPYANVHLKSVSLPPARPPVLRGTILVHNIVFEKLVGVQFTLEAR